MTAMTPSPQDDATGAAASSSTTSTSTFTDADAVRLGGWNAAHARVLAAASDGLVAAALVDTNGDGRHVDLSVYRRVDDAWVRALEYTDIGNRMAKAGDAVIEADPESGGVAYVVSWGRDQPSAEVFVDIDGDLVTARANAAGRWMLVRPVIGLDGPA